MRRAVLALLISCGTPQIVPKTAPGVQLASITVTSPVFTEGARIPVDATCDGEDKMPELVLSSPPDGTKALVLYVEDPDVPSGTFTHMVAFNVPAEARKLPAGELASPAAYGTNDFRVPRYSGPCPPKGEAHRYRFRVVAVDVLLKLPEGASKAQVDQAIDGHILGEGSLTGQFGH